MQLFCLTCAGGTAAFYTQLEKNINESIVVEKLEYAGHGERHKEPFYDDFCSLALDMYGRIKKKLKGKYALIGYSMGCISVTEILRLIISKHEIPLPQYVFLAAHGPFSRTEVLKTIDDVDDYVKNRTIKFGGIPDRLINNKSFWRMYLPIYKNDYMLIEKYKFEELDLNTKVPLMVFYSEEDTPLSDMVEWRTYYTGNVEFIRYDGSHFFINDHCKEICVEIENALGY